MKRKPDLLHIRLLKYFGLIVFLLGVLLTVFGVGMIRKQVLQRAKSQVLNDLRSAWSVLNFETKDTETILGLMARRPEVINACLEGEWNNDELCKQLELIRMEYQLDFLSIMSVDSRVVLRSAPPYNTGDFFVAQSAFQTALKGNPAMGFTLMTAEQLNREHESLADQAFIVREETKHARFSEKKAESRGMVAFNAVPIKKLNEVVGVMYAGTLLNRNAALVENIHDTVFLNDNIGSVTLFLNDCRVATTVKGDNGQVALGTLVSKEVANQVLDNGQSWHDRAFVVRDWYLTAYDPIRDFNGDIIGMLYVGITEAPFRQMIKDLIIRYAIISMIGFLVTLLAAFLVASHVAKPLHALATAADRMRRGEHPSEVAYAHCSAETGILVDSFNGMTRELIEREEKLRDANESLSNTNRDYMETLGFISHELKTPLGSIMNYAYLLGEQRIGDLNEKQLGAMRNIDRNTKRITEMVRHYLNLSRIENKELRPTPTKIDPVSTVINEILESFAPACKDKRLKVTNNVGTDCAIFADYNMTLEVFENIISNAVKYSDEGGEISVEGIADGNMVDFRIRNTGKGIAPENLKTVFNKFSRVNGEATRKCKGTGLGLFIAQHIVISHGGTINVDSKEGEWTEFRFTLPQFHEVKNNDNINSRTKA